MKSLNILFFVTAMLMAFVYVLSATPSQAESISATDGENHTSTTEQYSETNEETSRFLRQRYGGRGAMTCDIYPRVCRVPGSKGPDCCRKKCVNVTTDGNNCGMCGKKCTYSEICCRGKCVNPMVNKNHCGRCGNRCQKGDYCHHGMCSYAWI